MALMVSVEEPDVAIEAGLKVALVRRGNPETLRLTVPENPAPAAMVTVYLVEELRDTVALGGLTETEKSPLTTKVTLTL